MGKVVHDDVLDGALNILKNNCTRVTLCSQEPTSFAEANATYKLADQTVDSTDFTLANGDVSGRKVTVAAQTGVVIDSSGTSNHYALLDVANSKLLYVTTHPGQALTAANTADIGAFDIEIEDPT